MSDRAPSPSSAPPRYVTFAELVAHGRQVNGGPANEMPWSFSFNGVPITHENDECYLVLTGAGLQRFTPRDTMQVGPEGQLVVCYAEPAPAAASPPSPAPTPSEAFLVIVDALRVSRDDHYVPEAWALFLTALRSSASALAAAERDAARWRALIGCQRARVLGHAELGTPFQHIGFELWEQFPAADIRPGANEMSRADLTTFADAAAARAALAPRHPTEGDNG